MAAMTILRGQRLKLADIIPDDSEFQLGIVCNNSGLTIDFACFGLDANGKLSDDRYMTFFNQPTTPCGGFSLNTPAGDSFGFAIALQKIPTTICRLIVTAAVDGDGTMSQLNNSFIRFLLKGVEVAHFSFTGSDFSAERALMLLEIYRKDGIWRVAATGQGFNGGLDALVEHFGGALAESTTSTVPPSSPSPVDPLNPTKTALEEKIGKEAPQLLNLVKEAAVVLEKVGLQEHQARVALCLNLSTLLPVGFAEHLLALGYHFSGNASIDLFLVSGSAACQVGPITANNLPIIKEKINIFCDIRDKYCNDRDRYTVISYTSAIERIRCFYFSMLGPRNKLLKAKTPVYVVFLTSNINEDTNHDKGAIDQIRWSSYEPVFWQFIGIEYIGGREEEFNLLSKFDTLSHGLSGFFSGCYLDNANFFKIERNIGTLDTISDAKLYNLLMTEYPSWVKKAKDKGMLILGDDTGRNENPLSLGARLMKKITKEEDYRQSRDWKYLEDLQNRVEQQRTSLKQKYGDEIVLLLVDAYGPLTMFELVSQYGFDPLDKYKDSYLACCKSLSRDDGDYKIEAFRLLIKYGEEKVVKKIIKKQYWQGQTSEQVMDSLGEPEDIDTKIMKTKTTETWKYHETGKGRYAFRITLENGLVVGWQGKYDPDD